MSIELEYRLRGLLQSFLSRVGTPPVAIALLAVAVLYAAAVALLAEWRSAEVAGALVGSLAFELLAAALVLDGSVALLRATPVDRDAAGKIALRAPTLREWGPLLLRAAYLMAGLAFVASLLARDAFTLRIAEGETVTGEGAQFVDRDPPRRYSAGPFPVSFTVERVGGTLRTDGTTEGLSVQVREASGRPRTLRSVWPGWEGLGRVLRPSRAGIALRYAVAVENGGQLDTAFAKLDLLPAGTAQEVRSDVIPHRLVFAVPLAAPLEGEGRPTLHGVVLRNGIVVGEGSLDDGKAIRFDGLVLTVPETRRWVEIRMIRDPGLFIVGVAALLALAGVAVSWAGRRRARAA